MNRSIEYSPVSDSGVGLVPNDHRFTAPEWQRWPFNLMYRSFQGYQQWCQDAVTNLPGISSHQRQLATFVTRQWLDIFSPANFFWTNPQALSATVQSGGANLFKGAQNWWQDVMALGTSKQLAGTKKFLPGESVAVTPGSVVFRNHLIELIQYNPQTATVFAEPVLIVPPWIMKFYILDLSPGNSLVQYLVGKGHTVFIVSWRNPDSDDRDLGMDDYLKDGVMAAFDAINAIAPYQKIQGLGYCLGGTLLAIAASFMARGHDHRLNSLTLLTSELDFSEPGELGLFIDESQLAYLESIMAKQGYLDGKQMAATFTLLNARDLVWSRMVNAYLMGHDQPLNDMGAWNADATRMPYRQHSEYLRKLYLHNDLAEGRYTVDGQPIKLSDIQVPIFSLGTQRDTVVPWRTVYKINLLTHAEVTFCLSSGGHNVGVVNPPAATHGTSRSYQLAKRTADTVHIDPDTWLATAPAHEGSWWPAWEAWLQQRADKQIAPPTMGNESAGYPALEAAPGRYVFAA